MNEETYLIANLLDSPRYLPLVSQIKPEDFEDGFLASVFRELIAKKDLLTIADDLQVAPEKLVKLSSLADRFPEFSVKTYGYFIFERAKNKKLKELANAEKIDVNALQEVNSKSFFEEKPLNESDAFLKMVEDIYQGKPDYLSIPTGFFCIDNQIGGFRKSEAIFIGGRPASGKTTFGINIAYNMAKNKKKVLFCSLEMAARELHERLVKSITQINRYKGASQQDIDKVIKTSKAIKERLPLHIYDKSGMTIEDIFAKALSEKPDVIFIDHLAILKSAQKFRSRYEEVSFLSAKIKQLARERDAPVICLCQLNRALESREIKAPTLSDIRDSGSVEQDGDIIGFIYRPEYHLMQNEPDDEAKHIEWEEKLRAVKGKAQFIIAKNRRGYTGRFVLGFQGENYRFYEV